MSRKIITILSSLMIVAMFMLAGCSNNTPSGVVNSAMKDIKHNQNFAAYIAEGTNSIDVNSNKSIRDDVMKKFAAKTFDFDYEIVSETIEDDKASVEVNIKAYNIGKCFSNTLANNFGKLLMSYQDEAAMIEILSDGLDEELDKLDSKSYENNVFFTLTKIDGKWTMDNLTDEQMDAMCGGLLSFYDRLNS